MKLVYDDKLFCPGCIDGEHVRVQRQRYLPLVANQLAWCDPTRELPQRGIVSECSPKVDIRQMRQERGYVAQLDGVYEQR